MKKLLISVVLSLSAMSLMACPETKTPASTAAAPAAAPAAANTAEKKEPETKRVCIKVLDNKTNKEVEKCRTIKIHEKHEGTKVPPK
jgi:curli biogenesis system outer membrane secretion channel CsgG